MERLALDERKSTEALERAKLRRAVLAAAALEDAHPALLPVVFAEREVDGERIRQRARRVADRGDDLHRLIDREHDDEGVVFFLHGLGLELPADKIERDLRLRAQHQAARVSVEPVHVGDAVAHFIMDQPHEVLALLVPTIRGHEHPAGFVERDEGVVLEDDGRERHGAPPRNAQPAANVTPAFRRRAHKRGAFVLDGARRRPG